MVLRHAIEVYRPHLCALYQTQNVPEVPYGDLAEHVTNVLGANGTAWTVGSSCYAAVIAKLCT